MSIRPVVLNGMIQRTQDVGNLKQQEDNRPIVEQQNIQIEQQKMKGYATSEGYMGLVQGRYMLFASEVDYREYMED